jgi:tetratricopeptide (TPR) repeat protein
MARRVAMRWAWAVWLWSLLGAASIAPSGARAQDDAYRAAVTEAVREYDAGNHEESRALFTRAHTLAPNARTHRGIGMAEFELRNYAASIEQLELALRSSIRPLDGQLRLDAEQLITRARAFVGEVRVETRPRATEILLDGVPVSAVHPRGLTVALGDHVFEFKTAGFAAERRRLTVRGGESETLTVVFGTPLHPQQHARQEPSRWYKNAWLWTAVGALAAGTLMGTAVALTRDHTRTGPFDDGTANASLPAP